jgi:hypothetical protein
MEQNKVNELIFPVSCEGNPVARASFRRDFHRTFLFDIANGIDHEVLHHCHVVDTIAKTRRYPQGHVRHPMWVDLDRPGNP